MKIERVAIRWPGEYVTATANTPVPLPLPFQREVVRIAGEAMTNVVKHARARHAWIELIYPAHEGDVIRLVVRDDGIGCPDRLPTASHRGVRDMRERARMVEGQLTIEGTPGVGTVVTFQAPVPLTEADKL